MLLLLPLAGLLATGAVASSPAAWAAGNAAARAACLREARLTGATASGPILFSDTVGQTAFLLAGTLRGQVRLRVEMLCLYDRRSRHAEVSEAKGWTAR